MAANQLTNKPTKKTVADPSDSYTSMLPLWKRSRAVLQGESEAKAHDESVRDEDNLLIPFSPSMQQAQYDFFKKEAELPGLTAQYAKVLTSSLLRKESILELNLEGVSPEIVEKTKDWIKHDFTLEGQSLFSFLDSAIWEELQTFNSWVYVDLSGFDSKGDDTDFEEYENIPYASLYKAESVINVKLGIVKSTGKRGVVRFVTRFLSEEFTEDNPWHPTYVDTVVDHYLDEGGQLVIQPWKKRDGVGNIKATNGTIEQKYNNAFESEFVKEEPVYPMKFGVRLDTIPAWPLNGQFISSEPPLMPLIDREVSLYNKVSRRNHLLYGASTYTPVITGVVDPESQQTIVDSGLGSYLFLPEGASASILETPSGALSDMDRTITSTVEEMAKMGVRMLAPETQQSGVALELRNSSQTAQLGTLNTKISGVMTEVIAFMISWRFGVEVSPSDINYSLSTDFSPVAGGEGAMRLVTEWYQSGVIPRSTFLAIARYNDFLPADYDDESAKVEIEQDPLVLSQMDYDSQVKVEE